MGRIQRLAIEKADNGFQIGSRGRAPAQAGIDDPPTAFDDWPILQVMGGIERAPCCVN
jgi:hypothetical protein